MSCNPEPGPRTTSETNCGPATRDKDAGGWLVAIIAPIVLPQVATDRVGNLLTIAQDPGARHLLGTDTLGLDVLERLLVGTRPTVVGVVGALAVALIAGVPLGLVAGYFGGATDRVAGWLARPELKSRRLNVGLCWSGSVKKVRRNNPNCSLACFAPLAKVPGVAFFSLQKGEPSA